jgi:hypothetical protein
VRERENKRQKMVYQETRAGVVAHVVKHLPGKYKALSSNNSTIKKKKNQKNYLVGPLENN